MGSGSERVHVAFLQFNLFARTIQTENTTMRCDEVDHVTAHVLIGTRMSRVDDFCGSETPPQLMSTKNLMTLEYVVRSTEALRQMTSSKEPFGFVIQYEFRTDLGLSGMNAERSRNHLCYYIFNSSRQASGNIFSPNHPGYYPRNIDCHYIFHGSEKQVVVIHFEYFDVEGFSTCDDSTHSDYVLFSNYQTHDRTNRRYCGQLRPQHSIISESNYFRMMFKSNDIFDATGFYAHYQFITQQTSQINRVKITSAAESNSKYIVLIAIIVTLYALNEQSRHML
uniref:Suppressor of lurcher protein 1 n=1 Tax=Ascaris suum TaxID=6253 RepID=F1L977_ASCSU